jgi:hypothetical protein
MPDRTPLIAFGSRGANALTFRALSRILAGFLAIILALASGAAHAEIANGNYTFDFSGIVPLWDISGSYSGGIGTFAINFSIAEAPSGKLAGNGTFDVQGLQGEIKRFSGSMMGSSTDPHVAMMMLMSGTGDLQGIHVKVTFSANLHYRLDSANDQLDSPSGSGTVTLTDLATGQTVSRGGTIKRSAITPLPLPGDSTGGWTLALTLTPGGNAYTGTASAQTSTGVTADFTVEGTYDAGTDTSKLALVGAAGKLNLVISTSGATLNVKSAKGKIFGQTLNYQAH